MRTTLIVCTIMLLSGCGQGSAERVLFQDSFDTDSQGEYVENVLQLPPPEGLGFTGHVLPGGHVPLNWTHSDELDLRDPKKGLWVIPPDSGYMEQGGRSHNSVLFAKTPIPEDVESIDISFRQYRADNDPVMFVFGATEPVWDQGWEFGYMTQVPDTDSTTTDAYVSGIAGDTIIVAGAAFQEEWASHRIQIRGSNLRWTINELVLVDDTITEPISGYFGIRQKYERGTRYDDFQITLNPR